MLHQMLMPISVGQIVDALMELGGEAHASQIAQFVVDNGTPPFPADPHASVRARLQENCSSYTAYRGKHDIFQSNPGSGVWRLKKPESEATTPLPSAVKETVRNFDFSDGYSEGEKKLLQHFRAERNSAVVQKFKQSLAELRCEACRLKLTDLYGDIAAEFIEAHHRLPLGQIGQEVITKIEDFAALCPNCHRIIHKNYPLSVEELRSYFSMKAISFENTLEFQKYRVSWRRAVRQAIRRIAERSGETTFSRHQLVSEELQAIIVDVESQGITPAQTLSRILQELRDAGEIAPATGKGKYHIKNLK